MKVHSESWDSLAPLSSWVWRGIEVFAVTPSCWASSFTVRSRIAHTKDLDLEPLRPSPPRLVHWSRLVVGRTTQVKIIAKIHVQRRSAVYLLCIRFHQPPTYCHRSSEHGAEEWTDLDLDSMYVVLSCLRSYIIHNTSRMASPVHKRRAPIPTCYPDARSDSLSRTRYHTTPHKISRHLWALQCDHHRHHPFPA